MAWDARLFNVCVLGVAFMFMLTAFLTTANIEQTVLNSIHQEGVDGYTSLAIIYVVFAVSNWAAPSVISLTSPKAAMVIGSFTYLLFVTSFFWPQPWLIYLSSAVVGFGAALVWTGQGSYLVLNSDDTTIDRNAGVFWALWQFSMFFGNCFVYVKFEEDSSIDYDTRLTIFTVLSVIAVLGVVCFLLLPSVTRPESEREKPGIALVRVFKILATKKMFLLIWTFIYSGVFLSFSGGVYGTSLGNTLQLESSKRMVGLSGMLLGMGEVLGGLVFTFFGSRVVRRGRAPVVISGFCAHLVAFVLVYVYVPDNATIEETHDVALVEANEYLLLFCSFLFGLGDSCFNTQEYAILGKLWPQDSTSAMAIFFFFLSVGAAVCYFYSTVTSMTVHLIILTALGCIATAAFSYVNGLSLSCWPGGSGLQGVAAPKS